MIRLILVTVCVVILTQFQTTFAQNAADQEWTASMASGKLPIMYIDTEGAKPIVSKDKKIKAGLWIEIPENCPDEEFALGSENQPIGLTIKGRGNSTWLEPKKPYKLKFEDDTEIMGMPAHKHFALLAAYGNFSAWESVLAGFELSRLLGMPWAPRAEAVELVLNGSYEGLYLLVESIKIDENRVDIYEQPENNENPYTIPYGWLVEIDNYEDEYQVVVPYGDTYMRVTHKSPEELSDMQREWLTEEFTKISEVINDPNNVEDWVKHFDPTSFARYFIIREVMNDYDGFNGSTYLTRDLDSETWSFGPIWDCYICNLPEGHKEYDWTMNLIPNYSVWKILPEVFYTRNFQEAFLVEWQQFYPDKLTPIIDYLHGLYYKLKEADDITRARWGNAYGPISLESFDSYINRILAKAKWMDEHKFFYDDYLLGVGDMGNKPGEIVDSSYYTIDGRKISAPSPGSIYIKVDRRADGTTVPSKVKL